MSLKIVLPPETELDRQFKATMSAEIAKIQKKMQESTPEEWRTLVRAGTHKIVWDEEHHVLEDSTIIEFRAHLEPIIYFDED